MRLLARDGYKMSTNPIRPERSHCIQAMVPMRDGVRLNTFVFLPEAGGDQCPVILQRTPYGISSPGSGTLRDCTRGWLPSADAPMRGSILRGWQQITNHGYAAVYQDTRGRYGSEGQDRVYADDAEDGFATLNWIAEQDWTNHRVGVSGSSAGSTTALAAASQRHPSVKAFLPKSVVRASTTMWCMRELRLSWSAFGCGCRTISPVSQSRIARLSRIDSD
jgi:putative CocE/NonD family hydrolase